MKNSTKASIIFVLFFSALAVFSFLPSTAATTKFKGYKSSDPLKIVVVHKSVRQGGSSSSSSSRSYSGGGSSYGK